MNKYGALGNHLAKQVGSEIRMTFKEIEDVIGGKLPPTADQHRAWWSNNPTNNVMTKVWLAAGFQTEQVDMAARKLVFKRKSAGKQQHEATPARTIGEVVGMSDSARVFKPADTERGKLGRHPLIGWMKGTFTIEPGYDLTRPSMDEGELAEMEANLDRTADMVEQGMSKKR